LISAQAKINFENVYQAETYIWTEIKLSVVFCKEIFKHIFSFYTSLYDVKYANAIPQRFIWPFILARIAQ